MLAATQDLQDRTHTFEGRIRSAPELSMPPVDWGVEAAPSVRPRTLRRKSWRRRLLRDLRLYSPLAAFATILLFLLGSMEWLEQTGVSRAPYSSVGDAAGTISISSISNVSTAPPGIDGGAPRSP
jgi:hypothetical protein